MKRLVSILSTLVISYVLTACAASYPFKTPSADTNYGEPPAAQQYETEIKEYFERTLKDPESARYKFSKPIKAYLNEGMAYGGGVVWTGYLVDVEVNAKNSYGGYVGYKPYIVLLTNGAVFRVIPGSGHLLIKRVG